MVIDIHTHCFPDKLASRALDALAKVANNHPKYTDGTVKDLKKSMKKGGVDISVVLNIATKPQQTPGINRWAVESSDDTIIPFGTIHPDYGAWKEEIAFLSAAKIKGIKFHPDYQNFYIHEPRMYPIYEAIAKADMAILFHAGLDIGLPGPYKCMPDKLKKLMKDFPGAKFIAAHMGAYNYWDDVYKHLIGEKIYFDTSYCLKGMGPERLKTMMLDHGCEKILFGTDSPWAAQKDEVEAIRALGLNERQTDAILFQNSARLLELA